MELTLTPELEHLIQRKLDSGQYETPQQVLESAVHRLDQDDADFGWSAAGCDSRVLHGSRDIARLLKQMI